MLSLKRGVSALRRTRTQFSLPAHVPYNHKSTTLCVQVLAQRWYAASGDNSGSQKQTDRSANGQNGESSSSTSKASGAPALDLQQILGAASKSALAAQAQAQQEFNPDTNLPLNEVDTNGPGNNPFVPTDTADKKVLEDIIQGSVPPTGVRGSGKGRRPAPAPPVAPSNSATGTGATSDANANANARGRAAGYRVFDRTSDNSTPPPPPTVRLHLYVLAKRQNCIMTLADLRNEKRPRTIAWSSGGRCGFKGVGEGSYEAGYQCAVRMLDAVRAQIAKYSEERPRKTVELEILLRGFGQGRTAILKALTLPEGDGVKEVVYAITDRTQIKIGGVRLQKARRL